MTVTTDLSIVPGATAKRPSITVVSYDLKRSEGPCWYIWGDTVNDKTYVEGMGGVEGYVADVGIIIGGRQSKYGPRPYLFVDILNYIDGERRITRLQTPALGRSRDDETIISNPCASLVAGLSHPGVDISSDQIKISAKPGNETYFFQVSAHPDEPPVFADSKTVNLQTFLSTLDARRRALQLPPADHGSHSRFGFSFPALCPGG